MSDAREIIAGWPAEFLLVGAEPASAALLQLEVYDPSDGSTVVAPSGAGITEPRSGSYRALRTVPTPGSLMARWTLAGAPVAEEELEARAAVATGPPVSSWRPNLADVAAVVPAYTRGGFDDSRPQAGAEGSTFTERTSPTAAHVEGLIDAAVREVAGRAGAAITPELFGLARQCAVWHVAADISAGKMPARTDDVAGEYRGFISNYRASLDELTALVRRTRALRIA